MTAELRPCPFCGGEAHLQPFMGYWTVGCTDCFGAVVGKIETKEEAIKEWNKRPSPWHTGTPTEDGWYLVWMGAINGNFHERPAVVPFENVVWASHLVYNTYVAWQKIEPFEAST